MDIQKIIEQLRAEHAALSEAILALERLAANGQKRRGRPPKWMAEAKPARGVALWKRKSQNGAGAQPQAAD